MDIVNIAVVSVVDQVLISIADCIPASLSTNWMNLVRGYSVIPTLNAVIAGGDVYDYTFETGGPNVTYYRYIATDMSIDGFYQNFDGINVTDLIVEKKITL
jgi:hypothetical protein